MLRVLGPVELVAAGRIWDLGPPKQRATLAVLVAEPGRAVPVDTLADRVWDGAPPASARSGLHGYVMRLRRTFAAVADAGGPAIRIEHDRGGYRIDVEPDVVDMHRFRSLAGRARADDLPDADVAARLREALGLWRGDPFADVPGGWHAPVREALDRQRLDTVIAWSRVELRLGNHEAVVTDLHRFAAAYPLAEPLAAALIRALRSAGRDAEALQHYESTRRRLADDLGTDPGAELRDLYRGMLDADEPDGAGRSWSVAPAQLPLSPYGFSGRAGELAVLDDLLAAGSEQPAVMVAVLSGMAGVGKTTLAVQWSHRIKHRFPDGQLYVDLRGHDPAVAASRPGDVLHGFLTAFGVPADRIPPQPGDRSRLYRSVLAGRRVLVVLDNARDAQQVRPLLPGAPGSLVVVTGRRRLPGLVVAEGARPVPVDPLPPADARELFERRAGRTGTEPRAVDDIVRWCAGLPLALSIAGARAASAPRRTLEALAADVGRSRGLLDAEGTDDPSADARAVFGSSYRSLSTTAARLFRLLSLHPGPATGIPAAASAAGLPAPETAAALAELVATHLVTEPAAGRFTTHDLLTAYAAELAGRVDPAPERAAATRRLLDHYLHTAHRAALLLHPHRDHLTLAPPAAGVTLADPADLRAAQAWFDTEYAAIAAAVRFAATNGWPAHAWQLTWTMSNFLDRSGRWQDWLRTGRLALAAATDLGAPNAQAHAHHGLALASLRLGRYRVADEHLRRSVDLHRSAGDHIGRAHGHLNLALVCQRRGRLTEALHHGYTALDLFRAADHKAGQGNALNTVGWYHGQLGDFHRALRYCTEALAIQQAIGDRHEQAFTHDSIGFAQHRLGRFRVAAEHYRAAIDLWRDHGDRYYEAETTDRLGDAALAAGDPSAAADAWRRALGILDDLGHHDADGLRAKLIAPRAD